MFDRPPGPFKSKGLCLASLLKLLITLRSKKIKIKVIKFNSGTLHFLHNRFLEHFWSILYNFLEEKTYILIWERLFLKIYP